MNQEQLTYQKNERTFNAIKDELDRLKEKGLIDEELEEITLCVIRFKLKLPFIPILCVSKTVDINSFLRDVYGRRK